MNYALTDRLSVARRIWHASIMTAVLMILGIAFAGCGEKLSGDYQIIDAHEHVGAGADIDRLLSAMKATGIEKMLLLGSYESLLAKKPEHDYESADQNNLSILELARTHPDTFIPFVLIDTRMNEPLDRLREYVSKGARGVKLYNGLKSYRLVPADAPEMLPIYEYCERNRLPVLIHLDIHRYQSEMEHILAWYPNLTFIVPHLFCAPDKPELVARMFERYPNLYTDMSYGHESWMVSSFKKISENSEKLRDLVTKYQDRIFFGTDICVTGQSYKTRDYLINQISGYRKILEFRSFKLDVPMNAKKTEHLDLKGLHLDRNILKAIYKDNFERVLAPTAVFSQVHFDRDDLDNLIVDLPDAPAGTAAGVDGASDFRVLFALASNYEQPVGDVPKEKVADILSGGISNWKDLGGPDRPLAFFISEELSAFLKKAAPALERNNAIRRVRKADLVDRMRDDLGSLTLLPLKQLDHRIKVLSVGGISPLDDRLPLLIEKSGEPSVPYFGDYPLIFGLTMKSGSGPPDQARLQARELCFNPRNLKTVLLTGSSLIGQGIDYKHNPPEDPLWPLRTVAPVTRGVDIMHICNECPLVENCVQKPNTWKFCSEKKYIEAFKYAGVDVMELTGNHENDRGEAAALATMDLYRDAGIVYFGAGKDEKDSREIRVLDVRGTRIAFLGYNHVSGSNRMATADKPGVNGFDLDRMIDDIGKAKEIADFVFVNMHWGQEFAPYPRPNMVKIAHRALDAGAAAVTGTHPHQASAMEFYKDGEVFYGLGNFLFVHPGSPWTSHSLTVKYTFLGNKLINVRPVGAALENFQSRWLSHEEENELLARFFGHCLPRLGPDPAYDVIAAHVPVTDAKNFKKIENVLDYLGVDEAVAVALFDSYPDADAVRRSNEELLALQAGKIGRVHPVLMISPSRSLDEREAAKGAAGFRLLLDDGKTYQRDQVAAIAKIAASRGLFLEVETFQPDDDPGPDLDRIMAAAGKVPVVLIDKGFLVSRPERLAAALQKYPRLYVAVDGFPDKSLSLLADAAEQKGANLVSTFLKYSGRIVAGFGLSAVGGYKDDRKETQGLYFRGLAMRKILEKQEYTFPHLNKKGSEWGYNYDDEKIRQGLNLPQNALQAIYSNNISALLPKKTVE